MRITSALKHLLLQDRTLKIHDLCSSEAYRIHKEIIESKPLLKSVYHFYFQELLRDIRPLEAKRIVELGAGAYSLACYEKRVIATNLAMNEYIKIAMDGQRMPFKDNSLDGIVMINTMHHIPRPMLFFREVSRTLKIGGVMGMVEPYFGALGRLIYSHLDHEPAFDTPASWEIPVGCQANQKMPYHIFTRDKQAFEKRYPDLRIVRVSPHTCVTHLLSGGFTYKKLVPDFMAGAVWTLERALKPMRSYLGVCMTVVVRKISRFVSVEGGSWLPSSN